MNLLIVDSCVHPVFNVDENKFESTSVNNNYKIIKEFAITLPNDYSRAETYKYISAANKTGNIIPIISIDPRNKNMEEEIEGYKEMDIIGIKIHPRLLGWDWTDEKEYKKLEKIFSICQELSITIFFCTYYSSLANISPKINPLYVFSRLLKKYQRIKMVLMHAGGNQLIDYVEFARFNENIILDLSYSPIKFRGSSYDYDLIWTLKNFNNRICFGSDFPYIDRNICIDNIVEKMKIIYKTEKEIEEHKLWSRNIMNFMNL